MISPWLARGSDWGSWLLTWTCDKDKKGQYYIPKGANSYAMPLDVVDHVTECCLCSSHGRIVPRVRLSVDPMFECTLSLSGLVIDFRVKLFTGVAQLPRMGGVCITFESYNVHSVLWEAQLGIMYMCSYYCLILWQRGMQDWLTVLPNTDLHSLLRLVQLSLSLPCEFWPQLSWQKTIDLRLRCGLLWSAGSK